MTLAEFSKDPNLLSYLEPYLDTASEGVAQFEYDDYVWIDHAQNNDVINHWNILQWTN